MEHASVCEIEDFGELPVLKQSNHEPERVFLVLLQVHESCCRDKVHSLRIAYHFSGGGRLELRNGVKDVDQLFLANLVFLEEL